MLDRIQPTIRRDCNFYHLHKIKDQSEWDGEKWILPKMQIVKESLPGLNGNSHGNTHQNYRERSTAPTRIRVIFYQYEIAYLPICFARWLVAANKYWSL